MGQEVHAKHHGFVDSDIASWYKMMESRKHCFKVADAFKFVVTSDVNCADES
jgi:hypothetical protein